MTPVLSAQLKFYFVAVEHDIYLNGKVEAATDIDLQVVNQIPTFLPQDFKPHPQVSSEEVVACAALRIALNLCS